MFVSCFSYVAQPVLIVTSRDAPLLVANGQQTLVVEIVFNKFDMTSIENT